MADELVIRLKLDKSAADAAGKQFTAEEKTRNKELLDDTKIQEAAKLELVRRANQQKIKAAADAADDAKKKAREQAEAEKQASKDTAEAAKLARQQERQAKRDAADEAKRVAREQADAEKAASRGAAEEAKRQRQVERDAAVKSAAEEKATKTSALAAERTARRAAAKETAAEHRLTAAGVAAMAGAGALAWQALTGLARGYGDAVEKAQQRQKEMTATFSAQRDAGGELATLMGRSADNKFALDMAKYNVATGFKTEEGRQFLTELYNSGAQYKGANISDKEFDQFAEQAGQLAVARQIRPDIVGDVAGGVLGFTDYKKFGAQGSEQALGHVNAALSIMGRGKGDNAVLARQYSMLSSASLNEDEMRGTFQTPEEVAAAVSIAAEKHDAQAAELTKIAIRGLRGFGTKKKESPILKKAGITPTDSFMVALQKLAPVVEADAAKQGVKVEDILRQDFKDEGVVDALNVFINKGVSGGGFADRMQFGATVAGPKPALDLIKDTQSGERGQLRRADALVRLAEAERGAEYSKLEIVRKQALAELVKNKEIDTSATGVTDYMFRNATFGVLGTAEQRRIDLKARDILNRRTPEAAIAEARAKGGPHLHAGPEEVQDALNRQIDAIEKHGGNAFLDVDKTAPSVEASRGPAGAGGAGPEGAGAGGGGGGLGVAGGLGNATNQQLERVNQNLERQTKLLEEQKAHQQRPNLQARPGAPRR